MKNLLLEKRLCRLALTLLAGMVILASPAYASINTTTNYVWSGIDTDGPVQVYSQAGVFQGPWGMDFATGTALDGAGHVYTVQPDSSDSVITKYDASQTPIGTIHFTSGIDNGNGAESWIEDMAYAGNNTLWLSGYNGIVYHVDSAGTVMGHWDTGNLFAGVATDGSFVYTTTGFYSGNTDIDKWTLGGVFISSFSTTTGVGQGGLAYDSADGTFYVGTISQVVYKIDSSGNVISSFAVPGGANDGLEWGAIGGTTTPEPGTLLLLGSGLVGLGGVVRRRIGK